MVLSVIMSWLWKSVFTAPLDNLWPVISFLPPPWTWPGLEQNHKITPQSPFAHNVLSMCPSNEWCLFKTRAERWQCLKNRCWSIVWRHLEELKCLLRCIQYILAHKIKLGITYLLVYNIVLVLFIRTQMSFMFLLYYIHLTLHCIASCIVLKLSGLHLYCIMMYCPGLLLRTQMSRRQVRQEEASLSLPLFSVSVSTSLFKG